MPCRSYLGEEREASYEYGEKMRAEVSLLTALLCETVGLLAGDIADGSPELRRWVAEHEEVDRERQAAE